MAGEAVDDIPESGAVFTFGKSKFADNIPSKFWLKNDTPLNIACGDEHTALITENGKLFMFGSNNWGQLGLGSKTSVNKPTCVKALKAEKVRLVACGRNHTIVYTSRGHVYTSGGNNEGQLGLGDYEERTAFQLVNFLSTHGPIKMLAAGSNTSAALTESGKLFMWGDNAEGQIGLGKESNVTTPQEVTVGYAVSWVACGYYHSAFVTVDGGLFTFGERDSGKLGLTTDQLAGHRLPQLVRGVTQPVIKVACGGGHTVALTEEDVYTFGLGQFGQLGHGTFIFEVRLPRALEHFRKGRVQHIMCGENHTAVITDSGLLYTFGDGRHGKLGLGEENFTNQFKPTLCSRFLKYNVKAVTCGGCHMLVLARYRDKSCEEVTMEEDDVTENYLEKSYTELLGDTSTSLTRSLSARVRRRERERSPEQFGSMFHTLPSLTSGHLNPLSVSSQLAHRKVHNDIHQHRSTGSNQKERRNAKEGDCPVDNLTDNVSVKDLGDTTDFLNMTHVMKLDPSDKTLTLSPVQKRKGKLARRHVNDGAMEEKRGGEREKCKETQLPAEEDAPKPSPSPKRAELTQRKALPGAHAFQAQSPHHKSSRPWAPQSRGKENLIMALQAINPTEIKAHSASSKAVSVGGVSKAKSKPRPYAQAASREGKRKLIKAEDKRGCVKGKPIADYKPKQMQRVGSRGQSVEVTKALVEVNPKSIKRSNVEQVKSKEKGKAVMVRSQHGDIRSAPGKKVLEKAASNLKPPHVLSEGTEGATAKPREPHFESDGLKKTKNERNAKAQISKPIKSKDDQQSEHTPKHSTQQNLLTQVTSLVSDPGLEGSLRMVRAVADVIPFGSPSRSESACFSPQALKVKDPSLSGNARSSASDSLDSENSELGKRTAGSISITPGSLEQVTEERSSNVDPQDKGEEQEKSSGGEEEETSDESQRSDDRTPVKKESGRTGDEGEGGVGTSAESTDGHKIDFVARLTDSQECEPLLREDEDGGISEREGSEGEEGKSGTGTERGGESQSELEEKEDGSMEEEQEDEGISGSSEDQGKNSVGRGESEESEEEEDESAAMSESEEEEESGGTSERETESMKEESDSEEERNEEEEDGNEVESGEEEEKSDSVKSSEEEERESEENDSESSEQEEKEEVESEEEEDTSESDKSAEEEDESEVDSETEEEGEEEEEAESSAGEEEGEGEEEKEEVESDMDEGEGEEETSQIAEEESQEEEQEEENESGKAEEEEEVMESEAEEEEEAEQEDENEKEEEEEDDRRNKKKADVRKKSKANLRDGSSDAKAVRTQAKTKLKPTGFKI
ncbi:transcriptional regulator ATRX-like isoform X2 [Osmerus eperlanus]|uniref:transcriptional regulator ATRX-like isoform X2 n=1 Tax=Osmerus eperlanus TaxID=29151 RepID=UPI002E107C02